MGCGTWGGVHAKSVLRSHFQGEKERSWLTYHKDKTESPVPFKGGSTVKKRSGGGGGGGEGKRQGK